MTDSAAARTWPTCNPNGAAASVLLAFLTTAGLFYVTIMPALVAGLQDGLGFSVQDAGFVASANVYGAAIGGLVAVFTVRRLDWKRAAAVALALLIAVDVASVLIGQPGVMIVVRSVHGVVGGFLTGVGYSVIARTRSPDRSFGVLMFVQFSMGGLGMMVLPRLAPVYGASVLFLTLAAFSLVTLAMLPFLPTYSAPSAAKVVEVGQAPARIQWAPLSAALAAVVLFQASSMGLMAYSIGLGRSYGLATDVIATTSGLGSWIAAAGAGLVIVLGVRFGRLWPLLAGLAIAIGGRAAYLHSEDSAIFFLATATASATHAFLLPYLLGLVAAFDEGGQTAAVGGFMSKVGVATGPAVGALLLADQRYDHLVGVALVGLVLTGLVAAWPARRLDRSARERAAAG